MTAYMTDYNPSIAAAGVSLVASVSGNTVTLVPSSTITRNRRYVIHVPKEVYSTGAYQLTSDRDFFFTSTYSPLYGGLEAVRGKLGVFASRVSDDLINLHIWKASQEANRAAMISDGGYAPKDIYLVQILSYTIAPLSYSAVTFVESKAAATVLTLKYFEMMEDADRMKALPDYREQGPAASVLEELRQMIKSLNDQAEAALNDIKSRSVVPANSVRSKNWSRSEERMDQSMRGRIRRSF
jgi:hypothetical protein